MKKIQKAVLVFIIIISCSAYTSIAQIYVKIRPNRPHYVRTAAPSPRHIWVDEEWEPRGTAYAFSGGHWAEPPRERARWVPGHWRHEVRGDVWIPGHWR